MLSRRELLKRLALLTGGTLLPWPGRGVDAATRSDALGALMPQRILGKTGMRISMLIVGGSHIGRPSESQAEAVIENAIERGIRTFETAETYQRGLSEERFGKYLTPKYREYVQLFTKTMAEDAATAERHLDESLLRLKTDYLDLWQLHDVRGLDTISERVKRTLDVMLRAKESGKVKHIGFTGHTDWRIHQQALETTDQFETCLLPINVLDPGYESFATHILPILTERKMGVMAMKTLSAGGLLTGRRSTPRAVPERASLEDVFRFVWSLPVHGLVSGMAEVAHLEENADFAYRFQEMSEAERRRLVEKVDEIAATGEIEYYKAPPGRPESKFA